MIKNHHSNDAKADLTAYVDAIFDFSLKILKISAQLVPAVKINIAFFEQYLWPGIETYYSLISEAKQLGLEVEEDLLSK